MSSNQSVAEIPSKRVIFLGFATLIPTFITGYLSTVLLVFEYSFRRRKKNQKQKPRNKNVEKYAWLMRLSTILAATLAFLIFFTQALQIFSDLDDKFQFCDILKKIDFTLTSFLFISVYALLWLRMSSFYVNVVTKQLTSRCSRVYSNALLTMLFALSLINPVVFNTTQWFKRTKSGCTLKDSLFPERYHWMTLAFATFYLHASLLALFIYPITKHYKVLRKTNRFSGNYWKTRNLVSVIKRAFALALVCVISDVIVVVVNISVVTDVNVIPQVITNINLLVNTFSVVMTFVDWKERVFPCCQWKSHVAGTLLRKELSLMQCTGREEGVVCTNNSKTKLENFQ